MGGGAAAVGSGHCLKESGVLAVLPDILVYWFQRVEVLFSCLEQMADNFFYAQTEQQSRLRIKGYVLILLLLGMVTWPVAQPI